MMNSETKRLSAQAESESNEKQYSGLQVVTGPCIAMVRHDNQCAQKRGSGEYPYLSRIYDQNKKVRGLPESVRYYGTDEKGHVTYSDDWMNFLQEKNPDPKVLKYLERPQSGYRNYGAPGEFEQVTWGGAQVHVYKVEENKAYICAYDVSKSPQDYPNEDYSQIFSIVYTDDTIGGAPPGKALTLLMARQGEKVWMNVDDLYLADMPQLLCPTGMRDEAG